MFFFCFISLSGVNLVIVGVVFLYLCVVEPFAALVAPPSPNFLSVPAQIGGAAENAKVVRLIM